MEDMELFEFLQRASDELQACINKAKKPDNIKKLSSDPNSSLIQAWADIEQLIDHALNLLNFEDDGRRSRARTVPIACHTI